MSIAAKLARMAAAKAAIKAAIEAKGVTVGVTDTFETEYAGLIGDINTAKEEETKTVSAPDFGAGNIVVTPTQDKVMTQVTIVKDTTNHVAANIKTGVTLYGVAGSLEEGGGTPSGFEVRYIDYDGTIIETQYIASGEDATPPTEPSHTGLTFVEWNNASTNITQDRDIGATYETTDGATHAFVSVNLASELAITVYVKKSDGSTMTIDWGDGSADTTTTASGNTHEHHTYSTAGDYEISLWISSGAGTYALSNGSNGTSFIGGATVNELNMLIELWFGDGCTFKVDYMCYINRCLKKIMIPKTFPADGITNAGIIMFQNCNALRCVVIPDGTTSIPASFLNTCSRLQIVCIPDTLTSFGNSSFGGCMQLHKILGIEQISSLGSSTFYNCGNIQDFTLNASISLFDSSVFYGCMEIENVDCPGSLATINASAFSSCRNLRKLILRRTQAVTLSSTTAFENVPIQMKIYVPDNLVATYRGATNWSTFANYIYALSTL